MKPNSRTLISGLIIVLFSVVIIGLFGTKPKPESQFPTDDSSHQSPQAKQTTSQLLIPTVYSTDELQMKSSVPEKEVTPAAPYVPITIPEAIEAPVEPVPDQVVIQFSAETSAEEKQAYVESIGGTVVQSIDSLDSLVVSVSAEVAEAPLPETPSVVQSEPDYYVSALENVAPVNDPRYLEQWALEAIGAPDAWAAMPADAPAVTIAVIDSGICADHPDLQGRIVDGWDFLENDGFPQDDFGHGCAVAGVIAANMNDGIGIAGVAPNARIMPLRVLNSSGVGSYSDVAAAIVYSVDHGAQVINLSLGGSNASVVLENAVNYAVNQGVVVVAAAGNNGNRNVLYPAAYEPVIAVGSVDPNLQHSSFSNYGPGVDIWAPGRDILTTKRDGSHGLVSGTSFAAPYVAGAEAIAGLEGYQIDMGGKILSISKESFTLPTPSATPATTEVPAIDPTNTSSTSRLVLNISGKVYAWSLDSGDNIYLGDVPTASEIQFPISDIDVFEMAKSPVKQLPDDYGFYHGVWSNNKEQLAYLTVQSLTLNQVLNVWSSNGTTRQVLNLTGDDSVEYLDPAAWKDDSTIILIGRQLLGFLDGSFSVYEKNINDNEQPKRVSTFDIPFLSGRFFSIAGNEVFLGMETVHNVAYILNLQDYTLQKIALQSAQSIQEADQGVSVSSLGYVEENQLTEFFEMMTSNATSMGVTNLVNRPTPFIYWPLDEYWRTRTTKPGEVYNYVDNSPWRRSLNYHTYGGHQGTDIAINVGTPVYAAGEGVGKVAIVYMGCPNLNENVNNDDKHVKNCSNDGRTNSGYGYMDSGNVIILEYLRTVNGSPKLVYLYYGHLKQDSQPFGIWQGGVVTRGDHIAASGHNGYSSFPHLHFEVRYSFSGAYYDNSWDDPWGDADAPHLKPDPGTMWVYETAPSTKIIAAYQGSVRTGTVSGVVTNQSGQPISGVAVSAKSGGTSATTDSNGSYTLSIVPEGNTTIVARHNTGDGQSSITVIPDTCIQANITLSQVCISSNDNLDPQCYVPPTNDTTPPTGSWTSPSNNQTISSRSVTLSANASDNAGGSGVKEVRWSGKWGGNWYGIGLDSTAPYSMSWDLCNYGVPTGIVELGMEVLDNANKKWVYSEHFTNISITMNYTCNQNSTDITPPTGSWQSPFYGQTINSTSVTLSANASDNSGGSGVKEVRWSAKLNNQWTGIGTDKSAPYSYDWNMCTSGVPKGNVELGMEVLDNVDNKWVYSEHFPNIIINMNYTCGGNGGSTCDAASLPIDFTKCQEEGGGRCSFNGSKTVYYGANSCYKVQTKTDGVECNNDNFAPDPLPGVHKACYINNPPPPTCPTSGGVILYWNEGHGCGNTENDPGFRMRVGTGWQNMDGNFNEKASSVRIPSGWSVMLYEHGDRTGGKKCYYTNIINFGTEGNFPGTSTPINDRVSSIEVFNDIFCGELPGPSTPSLYYPNYGLNISYPQGITFLWGESGDNYTFEMTGGQSATTVTGLTDIQTKFSWLWPGVYSWRVIAFRNGMSAASEWRKFNVFPSVPGSVSVTTNSTATVTVNWTESSGGVDGYKVYRNGIQIASVGNGIRSYQVTGLPCSNTSTYSVRGYKGSLDSDERSATGSTTTCPVGPSTPFLSLPTHRKVVAYPQNVTFDWSDSGDSYTFDLSGLQTTEHRTNLTSSTTIVNAPLAGYYQWYVEAIRNGQTARSGTFELFVVPSAPASISATTNSSNAITINWTASTGGVTGYHIYRDNVLIQSIGATTYSYQVTGLSCDTTSTFSVSGHYGSSSYNEGPKKNITGTTLPCIVGPTVPTLISPANGARIPNPQAVVFDWSASGTNYTIEITGGTSPVTVSNTTDSLNFGSMWPKVYQWRVKAYRNGLWSAWSPYSTLNVPPGKPGSLNVISNSTSDVTLTWTDSPGGSYGFKIYRNGKLIDTVGSSAHTFPHRYQVSGLPCGDTSTYSIRGYIGSLNSDPINATGSTLACPKTVQVVSVFTTDGNGMAASGDVSPSSYEEEISAQTVTSDFLAGDDIQLHIEVENQYSTEQIAYVQWYVFDPADREVFNLEWRGNLTIAPGVTDWYLPSTISTDILGGDYQFFGVVTFNGEDTNDYSWFNINGMQSVDVVGVYTTDELGAAGISQELDTGRTDSTQTNRLDEVKTAAYKSTFNSGDLLDEYIAFFNNVIDGEIATYDWSVIDPWGRPLWDLAYNGDLSSTIGKSWWRLSRAIPQNAITGDYTFTGTINHNGRISSESVPFHVNGVAGPANDLITLAKVITSTPFSATLDTWPASVSSTDPQPTCTPGKNSNSVWYRYTPAANGILEVDTWGSDYDTVLALWKGTTSNLTTVACNDDIDGFSEAWLEGVPVTAGVTYYIEVMDFGTPGGGNLALSVDFAPSPSNDDFNTPITISTLPYSTSLNINGATQASDDPPLTTCNRLPGQSSVWYRYTPSLAGELQLDTAGSDFDTMLAVWKGSRGSLIPNGCNDDVGYVEDVWDSTSLLTSPLSAGTVYYIEVSKFNGFMDTEGAALTTNIGSGKVEANTTGSHRTRGSDINAQFWGGQMALHAAFTAYPVPGIVPLSSPQDAFLLNDSTPTFDWGVAANGQRYQIQVDNISTFSSPEQDNIGINDQISFTSSNLVDGKYYWRVRAISDLDVPGPWSSIRSFTIDTTPVEWGPYDDNNSSIVYNPAWVAQTINGNFANTEHYSTAIGSTAGLTFNGTGVTLKFRKASVFGNMEVWIDGNSVDTVNQLNGITLQGQSWISPVYSNGTHTIVLKHISGSYVSLDEIIVNGLPTQTPTSTMTYTPSLTKTPTNTLTPTQTRAPSGVGTYDERNVNIVYTGTWVAQSITGNYANTEKYSKVIGSTAGFTFNGNMVDIRYRKASVFGNMEVWIDGILVDTINQTNGAVLQNLSWKSPVLSTGAHTIVLKHVTGTYVTLDAIIISGPPTATPTLTNTKTPTLTFTPSMTMTPSMTFTPSLTKSPTNTLTPSLTLTPTLTKAPSGVGSYDERNVNIVYTGTWVAQSVTGNYLNTEKYSTSIGSTAGFTFTGNQVTIKFRKANVFGNMEVWIDGELVDTINQKNSITLQNQSWTSPALSDGMHTIILKHTSGTYVVLDAIIISGPPTATPTATMTYTPSMTKTATNTLTATNTIAPSGEGTYDERHGSIVYTGTWVAQSVPGNYANTEKYSTAIGSTAGFTFNGNQVTIKFRKANVFGNMEVWIDGGLVDTIIQKNVTIIQNQSWSSTVLSDGTHTIVLKHVTGTYVALDAIIITNVAGSSSFVPFIVTPSVTTTMGQYASLTPTPTLLDYHLITPQSTDLEDVFTEKWDNGINSNIWASIDSILPKVDTEFGNPKPSLHIVESNSQVSTLQTINKFTTSPGMIISFDIQVGDISQPQGIGLGILIDNKPGEQTFDWTRFASIEIDKQSLELLDCGNINISDNNFHKIIIKINDDFTADAYADDFNYKICTSITTYQLIEKPIIIIGSEGYVDNIEISKPKE